jgi:hypothetical protein
MKIGTRVMLPCQGCANADRFPGVPQRHDHEFATVTAVGKLITVKLDKPPVRWRERGLSDHAKFSPARLAVVS